MNSFIPTETAEDSGRWPMRALVLVFYLCFFVLLSSGRLSGGDPNQQIRGAMLLAATGIPGQAAHPDNDDLWVQGMGGLWYEAHDLGNIVIMLPSALVGSLVRDKPVDEWVEHPPLFLKVGVSLTYGVASAVGAYFMFLLCGLFHPRRTAFALSLAFVVTTPFWAFSKSGWDVLGAAIGVCMLLYFSARLLLRDRVEVWTVVFAAAALAITCSFRYSLMPFISPALAAVFWLRRKDLRVRGFGWGLATFALLMLPTFVYNYIRMGSPLRPATVSAKYMAGGSNGLNALTGDTLSSLFGLLLSPNWGLVWFSPAFLLLATLPFVFKRLPSGARQMSLIWGASVMLYLLLISQMENWHGVIGWGSRYLVPVMPILFFVLSCAMAALWERRRKLVLGLLALSFIVNLPSALVNWHQATLDYPPADWPDQIRYRQAWVPRQQIAMWKGFINGLQGRPLPSPPSWEKDPVLTSIAEFPDLLVVRLMRRSETGLILGLAITLALGAMGAWAASRLIRSESAHRGTDRVPVGTLNGEPGIQ